jgi:transposase-like protein
MPYKEVHWICKKCHRKYEIKELATKCESTHYKVKKIINSLYVKHRAPDYLKVEVDIGGGCIKDVTYELKEEGWGRN